MAEWSKPMSADGVALRLAQRLQRRRFLGRISIRGNRKRELYEIAQAEAKERFLAALVHADRQRSHAEQTRDHRPCLMCGSIALLSGPGLCNGCRFGVEEDHG